MSYHRLLYNQEEKINSERTAAVGSLAATMAHEIRNPLATIFSSLSQIKKHAHITGDAATLLQIAEEEAVRMNRIVSGLLEFARPGVPRFDRVNLVDIAKDVATETRKLIDAQKNIEIVLEPESTEMTADVDATMVKKALHHVMENAVAAVDPKKGRIVVKIVSEVEQHQKKDVVKITVEDDGIGVTKDIQNKVFEPFYSTKPSGIGLGLPTVARIINDHGGMVNFSSEPKEGTVVSLTFFKERRVNNGNTAAGQ
jgi:signal transduction histidine kinase